LTYIGLTDIYPSSTREAAVANAINQKEAERIAYVSAERAERLAECEERAPREKPRAYAAEWAEPGPDPLSPDRRAALNAAMALCDRAFGKGAVVPASRMEAA